MWRDERSSDYDESRRRVRAERERDDRRAGEDKYEHGSPKSREFYRERGEIFRQEERRRGEVRRKVANPRDMDRAARKERQRRQRVDRGRDILKGDPEARKKAKQYAAKYKEGHDRGLVVDGAKAAARDRFSSQEQETRQVRPPTAARRTIRKAVRGYQAKSEAERRRKERDREGFGQERRRWGRGRSRKRRGGRTKRHKGRRRRCPKTGKPICYCKPKIKSRRGGRRTRRRR